MRACGVLLVIAMTGGLSGPSVAQATVDGLASWSARAASSEDRCTSSGRTVFSTSRLLVFRTPSPRYVLCIRRTGRRIELLHSQRDYFYALKRFRAAGNLIAYEHSRSVLGGGGVLQPTRRIIVRSIVTGRSVRKLPVGVIRGAAFIENDSRDGVRALQLDSGGGLAWIVRNPFAIAPPTPNVNTSSRATEVYVAPRGQGLRLVDQGDAVVETSLRRSGCAVDWLNGSTRRSASICFG